MRVYAMHGNDEFAGDLMDNPDFINDRGHQ